MGKKNNRGRLDERKVELRKKLGYLEMQEKPTNVLIEYTRGNKMELHEGPAVSSNGVVELLKKAGDIYTTIKTVPCGCVTLLKIPGYQGLKYNR